MIFPDFDVVMIDNSALSFKPVNGLFKAYRPKLFVLK